MSDYRTIKERAFRGSLWMFAGQAATQALQIFALGALARLLTPEDFGLTTMAAVVVTVLAACGLQGFSTVIVQQATLEPDDLNSIWTANWLLAALLYLVLWCAAPVAAVFYDTPAVAPIIRVAGVLLLLIPLSLVQTALLRRDMAFHAVSRIQAISQVLSMGCAVGAAAAGWGYWSLVIQPLTRYLFQAALCWRETSFSPRLRIHLHRLRRLWRPFWTASGYDAMEMGIENLDYLLLGRFFGGTFLGLYTMAFRLATLVNRQVLRLLGGISLAAFSRLQNEREMLLHAFGRSLALMSLILSAGMFFLAATPGIWLRVLGGPQWEGAAVPLAFLALASIFQGRSLLFSGLYLGLNLHRTRFAFGLGQLLSLGAFLWIGIHVRPDFWGVGFAMLLQSIVAHAWGWLLLRRAAGPISGAWGTFLTGGSVAAFGIGAAYVPAAYHAHVWIQAGAGGLGLTVGMLLVVFKTEWPGAKHLAAILRMGGSRLLKSRKVGHSATPAGSPTDAPAPTTDPAEPPATS